MEICDVSFDEEFKAIEGLRGYPSVGTNYKNVPTQILIVGESFFRDPKDPEWDNKYKDHCRVGINTSKN